MPSRKRGRPRKPNAKRNATTRAGRKTGSDPVVLPTAELRAKRRATTGREDLPHDEPLATLYGRGFLSTEQYNTGRGIAELIQATNPGVPSTIWQRILGAPGGGPVDPGLSAPAERAARMLQRLAKKLGSAGIWVFAVCGGIWLPWITRIALGQPLRQHEVADLELFTDLLDLIPLYWSPRTTTIQQ
jgi:hypothetical protein